MSDDALPEADRVGDAPHPRETTAFFGHDETERELAATLSSGAYPHGWLLTGPRGVGKATLAWRMARFLLSPKEEDGLFGEPAPASTLDVPQDTPVARRIAALSEPGLLLIRRAWDPDRKRLKTQITVDEVRKINSFFGLSAADGGHRVVILDSADELNTAAANALLKVLEEPPKDAVLILISHQPARLLPTIRSRCRQVRLSALSPDALASALAETGIPVDNPDLLAEVSGGSVGDALRLITEDGLALFERIERLIDTCPSLDRGEAMALAEYAAQRGQEQRLDLTFQLIDIALSRRAKAKINEAPVMARTWAEVQQSTSQRVAHGRAVNIDPQNLLLDCFLKINAAVATAA